jgi:hypothetical protein
MTSCTGTKTSMRQLKDDLVFNVNESLGPIAVTERFVHIENKIVLQLDMTEGYSSVTRGVFYGDRRIPLCHVQFQWFVPVDTQGGQGVFKT